MRTRVMTSSVMLLVNSNPIYEHKTISFLHKPATISSILPITTMLFLELAACLILFIFSFLFLYFISSNYFKTKSSSKMPKSFPFIGSYLAIFANRNRLDQWIAELLGHSTTDTIVIRRAFGARQINTANPENIQHILKTRFSLYPKGDLFTGTLGDFLGTGIFNVDGNEWKFQRKVSSLEFNTRSLRKFVESVVEGELSDRLIPILDGAAANNSVLDMQDILQRFAFDNICKIAFGYDPGYLSASLPQTEFAVAFEKASMLSSKRFAYILPMFWKVKRALDIGSEKQLRQAVSEVREFAQTIVKKKKQELEENSSLESVDLLSRFLSSGHSGENFVTDMVISFIVAGRDTTSAALTWYFWLLSQNLRVQEELLKEIGERAHAQAYDQVKDLIYTHASLCESMRLYPPVPGDMKEAAGDDILPDGTIVKKGMRVAYHPYAMGRMEKLWGPDCMEFKPERWLENDQASGKLSLISKDPYMYPVFQAGPRVCLGKDMAFLQMKSIVAGVLRRYRVVPMIDGGSEPVFFSYLTAKMKGGLPVRIEMRE